MSQDTNTASSPIGTMVLTFLAGAAVGAVVVALTTPKKGAELRGDIKDLAARTRGKAASLAQEACGAWDGMKERVGLAAADLQAVTVDPMTDFKN